MFELSDLKQTKFYQEAFEEGKLKGELNAKLATIPRMIQFGLSVEEIARLLDFSLEVVQEEVQKLSHQTYPLSYSATSSRFVEAINS
jgi:predicted transposase YdaD